MRRINFITFFLLCTLFLLKAESIKTDFNRFIDSDEPEQAEKLLNSFSGKIPAELLSELRVKLAESYFRNMLYDKSLEIYRHSGRIEQNPAINFLSKADPREVASEKVIVKYLRKTGIPELLIRYMASDQNKRRNDNAVEEFTQAILHNITLFVSRNKLPRAEFYIRANIKYLPPDYQKIVWYRMGREFLRSLNFRNYDKALHFITKSMRSGRHPELMLYKKSRELAEQQKYHEALKTIAKTDFKDFKAMLFGKIADELKKEGRKKEAKLYYQKGLDMYNDMLFSLTTPWSREYNRKRLSYNYEIEQIPASEKEKTEKKLLSQILSRTGVYCKVLDDYAIYYYCREKLTEKINYSLLKHVKKDLIKLYKNFNYSDFLFPTYKELFFDYQILKEGKEITETRKQLKNPMKRLTSRPHPGENSTETIEVKNYFYGPVGLLHKKMQRFYTYRLLKDKSDDKKWVVDVIPNYPGEKIQATDKPLMYGRVSISRTDYSITAISWIQKFNKRFEYLKTMAFLIDKMPDIEFITEYGIKKGALRYPSDGLYREIFINKDSKHDTLSSLSFRFNQYKFFNTATDLKSEKLAGR